MKFRKEIMKGFLSNKVRRDDQASRLRECSKGNAGKLVPVSMECIDDCWSTLDTIYRDPYPDMNARKKTIQQMEKFLSDETSPTSNHLSSISMEMTIKDIVELAEDDEDMEREAYVNDMFSLIAKLLPFSIQEKIA